MTMPHRPEAILVAIAWERAKGEMRAAVAALGALPPVYGKTPAEDPPSRWKTAHQRVETFIKYMDDEEHFSI